MAGDELEGRPDGEHGRVVGAAGGVGGPPWRRTAHQPSQASSVGANRQ